MTIAKTPRRRRKRPLLDPLQPNFLDRLQEMAASGVAGLDLVEVPAAAPPAGAPEAKGRYDDGQRLRRLLTAVIKASPFDRPTIARHMSELVGEAISAEMLNKWTAPSRDGHRFPAEYLRAFLLAVGPGIADQFLTDLIDGTGYRPISTREAELARLGQLQAFVLIARTEIDRLVKRSPLFAAAAGGRS
ncbi:MAG: hypothetical protein GC168_20450 [Candidatus Hydrogenedens sp.]|nr:hypothetical protein [Candidatus Hydrogenedens sp.]